MEKQVLDTILEMAVGGCFATAQEAKDALIVLRENIAVAYFLEEDMDAVIQEFKAAYTVAAAA